MPRRSLLRLLHALVLVGAGAVAAGPAVAQSYVVTYVRGAVERSGRPLQAGDRLRAEDRVRFATATDLVVVASPAGQAVLSAARTGRRNARARAVALYVRDLLAPALDRAPLNTRGGRHLGPSFATAGALRRGLGTDRWTVIGPQALLVSFAGTADRFEVRYADAGGGSHEVVRRPLPFTDGVLTVSREALGSACSDPAARAPTSGWLVHLPISGPEAVVTAPLLFVCPDEPEIRAGLQLMAEATGTSIADGAETFVTAAYGPTSSTALRAWTEAP